MSDRTLQSNVFSAYVPNPALPSRVAHLLDGTIGAAFRGIKGLFEARQTPSFKGIRPPGDVGGAQGGLADATDTTPIGRTNLSTLASGATLGSRETWRDLPILPLSQVEEVQHYSRLIGLSAGPTHDRTLAARDDDGQYHGVRDAFVHRVANTNGRLCHVLPDQVRNSSLINQSASFFPGATEGHRPGPGKTMKNVMTHLWDDKTGFSAGITYDTERRELTIAFPGLGSSGKSFAQAARCAMNFLGFVPKNMSQASQLTRLVKQHVDELNATLPPEQQIRLTLAGHSMGGGLASYAALRNDVPAIVFNPMRLGWGARASIGESKLERADEYLTEVVTQGDWVADNNASKLYAPVAPVFSSRGPIGNARRFMIPAFNASVDVRHNRFGDLAGRMQDHANALEARVPSLMPFLHDASPLARGKMLAGKLAPAIEETIREDIRRHAPHMLISGEIEEIAGEAEALIRGTDRGRTLSPMEINARRQRLGDTIDSVRAGISGGRLPDALAALLDDCVTRPRSESRFADYLQYYAPGVDKRPSGPGFDMLMDGLFSGSDADQELKDSLLAGYGKTLGEQIERELKREFGDRGQTLGGKDDAERNGRKALQAVMRAVGSVLESTKHLFFDDDAERLDELITQAKALSRSDREQPAMRPAPTGDRIGVGDKGGPIRPPAPKYPAPSPPTSLPPDYDYKLLESDDDE